MRLSAKTAHAIADELGVDPELVGSVNLNAKPRSTDALKDAVRAYVKAQTPDPEPASTSTEPKKKKAGLTLSQRRALLRLLDEVRHVPASPFRSLPFVYLTENGLAACDDEGGYTLTDDGVARAESVNPGYRDWAAGETVVEDADGNPVGERPKHGEYRRRKAEEAAARAAEANAAPAEEVAVAA